MEQEFEKYLENEDSYDKSLKIINQYHPFSYFIRGLTYNTLKEEILGFYDENTNKAYFICQRADKYGIVYTYAWKLFIENEETEVNIYSKYCGQFYLSNEYETDKKYFNKYIMNVLSEIIFD